MPPAIKQFLKLLVDAARDLAPIIGVIAVFQLFVLQQPFPDLGNVIAGLVMVLLGLTFFIQGLEMGLFPIGETMARLLARRGSAAILFLFSFTLGFGTTIAEPALIAVANEAARAAVEGGVLPKNDPEALTIYADGLRYTVAVSVGLAIVLGVFRILIGWPLQWFILGGYALVVVLTHFAPASIIGIAYDSGGVTTSTITVPLVTALGVGLANAISGRNPLIDGFGLIAFASLTPIIFVMLYGMAV